SQITPSESAAVNSVVNQLAGISSRQPAPSQDNNSNVGGFVVQLPTQNIEWSNPSGDLRVNLAPEFAPLNEFFHGGTASR
ncbi:MAG: hypothetical protein JO021_21340, partial [Alphaproteobacteria bacterium]|nr:hypothetical protein [Alphaproteobacteria bacterium]